MPLAALKPEASCVTSSEQVDVEVDLDKEVHAHLELLIAENIRAGMAPKEAERAARIELGGIEQVKELVRERRIGNGFAPVISDCRAAAFDSYAETPASLSSRSSPLLSASALTPRSLPWFTQYCSSPCPCRIPSSSTISEMTKIAAL